MAKEKRKIRVGVFAGGASSEREVSLKSAAQVAKHLSKAKYDVSVIELGDTRSYVHEAVSRMGKIDIAFIAMHGTYAEDGRLQSVFELLGIPYTGSGVLASALGMNKTKAREVVGVHGVRSPQVYVIPCDTPVAKIHTYVSKRIGYPCVVKPNESGSSVGVSLVQNKKELEQAVQIAGKESAVVIVEQHIKGRELTCGVLGNAPYTTVTVLPVVEIIAKNAFFDYEAKYESVATEEICPAHLPKTITKKVQELARMAHQALECAGLTRSDFILDDAGKLYFLETNTIPGITEQSLCPKEAKAAGISFPDFLDMQITMALEKGRRM